MIRHPTVPVEEHHEAHKGLAEAAGQFVDHFHTVAGGVAAACGLDVSAIDVHFGLTEDITLTNAVQGSHQIRIHVLCSVAAPAVLASTTAEDVAQNLTVVHLYIGHQIAMN